LTDELEAPEQPAETLAPEPDDEPAEQPDDAVELATGPLITLNVANDTLQTLSVSQRRIGLRLLPYNQVAHHPKYGSVMFEPGAFVGADLGPINPKSVRLRMDHEDPPTGLGDQFTDMPDAPYMEFVVSKTERGNDQLTLANDGVSRGASVGFNEITGKAKVRQIGGRNVTVYPPGSAILAEVSTTWQPTFVDAGVMYVLSKDEKGSGPAMAEAQEAPASGVDYDRLTQAIVSANSKAAKDDKIDLMLSKFDEMVELQRASFTVPAGDDKPKGQLQDWVSVTLRSMAGEQVSPTEIKALALDDVVIGEQPGLVPAVFTPDYDDIIDNARPFLESTKEVRPPASGTTMTLPIITARAVAGTQAGNAEKGALTTTAPKVGTGTFSYKSVFGGADISIQMILRADRAFFDLLTGELGEAYALDCESKAIAALLAGYSDSASVAHQVTDGGVLDPEDPNFGEAWENSITSTARRAPTHIWLSGAAVGAFIDAHAPLTNRPLYSNLAASFTAGGGPGGRLSGLIPVYVPALDLSAVDVLIGPSTGFVWAEDPAIRLTADVPSIAGRDIVLAGGLFPAPRYADAFTKYTIGS
jgi:phage head maturation protease